jgi:hypothetical protein
MSAPAARTAEALLLRVIDERGFIEWEKIHTLGRPALRVPRALLPEFQAAPGQVKDRIREILYRAGHFRTLAQKPGPDIPWMTLPMPRWPTWGLCTSCGEPSPRWRCSSCGLALALALGLDPAELMDGDPRLTDAGEGPSRADGGA